MWHKSKSTSKLLLAEEPVYWFSFIYAQVYPEKPNNRKNVFTQCLFPIELFIKNQPD